MEVKTLLREFSWVWGKDIDIDSNIDWEVQIFLALLALFITFLKI